MPDHASFATFHQLDDIFFGIAKKRDPKTVECSFGRSGVEIRADGASDYYR
jgi:hypothetical protein